MTEFLSGNLLPNLTADKVIVMDNCRFHHSAAVRNTIAANGNRLIYLPPYSPQLNPIEQFFACVKQRLRNKRPIPKTTDYLVSNLEPILLDLQRENLQNYWREMRRWLDFAYNKIPFEENNENVRLSSYDNQ